VGKQREGVAVMLSFIKVKSGGVVCVPGVGSVGVMKWALEREWK